MIRFSFFILLLSILLYFFAPDYPSRPFMGGCILAAMLLVYFHIKGSGISSALKNIYFRHSSIFLLFYFIVFFQRAIDFSLGIIDKDSLSIYDLVWASAPSVVSKASALALLGLSAFMCGYYKYNPVRLRGRRLEYSFKHKSILLTLAFFSLILYIYLTGIGNFSKHSEDENITFLIFGQAVFLALIVIYSYDYKHKYSSHFNLKYFVYPLILIGCYLFVYFATGNRGGAIKVCIMLLAAYVYIVKEKVNYKAIFIVSIIGVVAMTIIGVVRVQETKDIHEASLIISAKETISPWTVELAGSVNTVHVALANVPSKKDFNYGSSFFSGFSVLIPGLSRLTNGLAEPSGIIITNMYFGGQIPEWGWGLGSSCLADAYISFGILGVILIFYFLGRFIHYLEYGTFVLDKSPYFLVLSICVFSQFHSLCRGSFASLFLSWDYALIIVFFFVSKYRTKSI